MQADFDEKSKKLIEENKKLHLTVLDLQNEIVELNEKINDFSDIIGSYKNKKRKLSKKYKNSIVRLGSLTESLEETKKDLDSAKETIKRRMSVKVTEFEGEDDEYYLYRSFCDKKEHDLSTYTPKNISSLRLSDDLEDFNKDSRILSDKNREKKQKPKLSSNIEICKVVKYNSYIWCLVCAKNEQPEYCWYEKEIIHEIFKDIKIPVSYEDELEQKILTLSEENKELYDIKKIELPENFKSKSLVEAIRMLIESQNKKVIMPIKISEIDSDVISGISPVDSDRVSDSSVQVTAEEANQVFIRMKNLEEENSELESRIMLLNQQLDYFKNEGKLNKFDNKINISVEQVRVIIVSFIEKLPIMNGDIEDNIKVILNILCMNKEAVKNLMENRGAKGTPEKKVSGFKKLFSKKK